MKRMKVVSWMSIWTVAAAALAASCGNGSGASTSAARDSGIAGSDGGGSGEVGGGSDASDAPLQCPTAGNLVEPQPRPLAFDGGVPLDQFGYALAVARCTYWSRCAALPTYLANQCVDALASDGMWSSPGATISYPQPSPALLQAAASGVARYDPDRAGQCVAALLTEGCVELELVEAIPACVGVIACVADGGAGDDAGTCSGLLYVAADTATCATDEDCAGLAAPEGPHCVEGFCTPSACGFFPGCTTFAQVGQACDSNAESILSPFEATPTDTCAPGLRCQGTTADGGLGTCVVPQDVGGACVAGSSCKPGLACACGVCEIPPTSGPCVDGLCQIGVAYCDVGTGTCRPVRQLDASCADAPNSCAPALTCDLATSTCQSPSL